MSRLSLFNEASMADLLGRHAATVAAVGAQRWQFHLNLRGEAGLDASLRIERDWLRVLSPLEGGGATCETGDAAGQIGGDRLQAMLAANARLAGGVKFVLADDPPRPLLAAEIPFSAEEDFALDDRIGQLCRGLKQGARLWRAPAADLPGLPDSAGPAWSASRAEGRFEDVGRELGWALSRRCHGRLALRLDLREVFYQAVVEATGEEMRLCAALEQSVADDEVCRRAADVLLLSACGAVRMAVATAVAGGASRQYRWEAVLSAASPPSEWGHALAALTIACQATASELGALEDPVLAESYLQLQGMGRVLL